MQRRYNHRRTRTLGPTAMCVIVLLVLYLVRWGCHTSLHKDQIPTLSSMNVTVACSPSSQGITITPKLEGRTAPQPIRRCVAPESRSFHTRLFRREREQDPGRSRTNRRRSMALHPASRALHTRPTRPLRTTRRAPSSRTCHPLPSRPTRPHRTSAAHARPRRARKARRPCGGRRQVWPIPRR